MRQQKFEQALKEIIEKVYQSHVSAPRDSYDRAAAHRATLDEIEKIAEEALRRD